MKRKLNAIAFHSVRAFEAWKEYRLCSMPICRKINIDFSLELATMPNLRMQNANWRKKMRIIFTILNFRTFKQFIALSLRRNMRCAAAFWGNFAYVIRFILAALHCIALFPSHRIRLWLIVIECIFCSHCTKNKVPVHFTPMWVCASFFFVF